ncbi:hypothetical protein CEXT_453711 [Caerostris extrusa]|uniref:Uncharacterized protein n=1 Tax=Caerostris extrusa TaxID=172846 RepID=A0AAV4TM12_CAEEX|nr:hypothetical protein CEXT_453711 [Caerostris extrusa]
MQPLEIPINKCKERKKSLRLMCATYENKTQLSFHLQNGLMEKKQKKRNLYSSAITKDLSDDNVTVNLEGKPPTLGCTECLNVEQWLTLTQCQP